MSGAGEASVSLNSFYGRAAVKASRPQERSSRQSATYLALVESGASYQGRLSADRDCGDFAPAATSRVTTAFAPTVVPSPMVMLRMTMAPRSDLATADDGGLDGRRPARTSAAGRIMQKAPGTQSTSAGSRSSAQVRSERPKDLDFGKRAARPVITITSLTRLGKDRLEGCNRPSRPVSLPPAPQSGFSSMCRRK
jgi:hypothetical protein